MGRVVDASWSGRSGITIYTGFWCFSQKKSTPNHLWSSQIMKNVLKINFQQSYRRISWQKWDFSGFRSFLMIFCSYKSSKMTNFPIPVVIYLAKSQLWDQNGRRVSGGVTHFSPTYFLWKTLRFFLVVLMINRYGCKYKSATKWHFRTLSGGITDLRKPKLPACLKCAASQA